MPNTECYHRPLALNEQIGQYRITSRLGQGGMGEIFAAHDEALNRTVAVKMIASSRLASDLSRRFFLRSRRVRGLPARVPASCRGYFSFVTAREPTRTSALSRSIPWRLSSTAWRIRRIIVSK